MRIATGIAVLLMLLALGAMEAVWRIEHPLAQQGSRSPDSSQVAEIRFMPEGSSVPYGAGVFLRPAWSILQRWQADLVFAGYCETISARWQGDDRLSIRCEVAEGEPLVPSAVVNGTAIEVAVQRREPATRHPLPPPGSR